MLYSGLFSSSVTEARTTRGDIELVEVPASEMAEKMGNPKGVNTIMLGAFVKKSNLVTLDSLMKGLEDSFKIDISYVLPVVREMSSEKRMEELDL